MCIRDRYEVMLHYRPRFFHRFTKIQIRFGHTKMNALNDSNLTFTDDHNALCATHGTDAPIADYGVYRCNQVLTGQYLTIQRMGQPYLEIAEVDLRVVITTGNQSI